MNFWIPFLHVMLVCLSAFVLICLNIVLKKIKAANEHRRIKLRDKLHSAMSQSPKRRLA